MSDPRDDLAALILAPAHHDLEAADLPWWPALDSCDSIGLALVTGHTLVDVRT